MSYFVSFAPDVMENFTRIIEEDAPAIWGETGANYTHVRIIAANYAGYGRYVARCHSDGLLEFPTGNQFSYLATRDGQVQYQNQLQKTLDSVHSTLLHELGHHTVNTSKHQPWAHLRAGSTTHTTPSWCWIAATGWKYYHPEWAGSPEMLALMVRRDHGSIAYTLAHFHPLESPPVIPEDILAVDLKPVCQQCGSSVEQRRDGTKYCSPRCRVAAHRSKAA